MRGAVATIRDSAFRATTNERGRFALPFALGSFTLRIEADHSPNAGGPPVDCPLRNGVIPCTEECYRADARWPGPDDPAAFLANERTSGECYGL